jgi:hypothetical protein
LLGDDLIGIDIGAVHGHDLAGMCGECFHAVISFHVKRVFEEAILVDGSFKFERFFERGRC